MAGQPDRQVAEPRAGDVTAVRTVADLALLLRMLRRREARRRGGAELTYRELAARAGWSHTVVADYLTGKTLPPTDRFDTLVRLLGAGAAEQGALATARDRVAEARRSARPAPAQAAAPVPRQLPADVPGLTGRQAALTELDRLRETGARSATMVITVLTGTPGVGKTALAVHWSHRVKQLFPDGQLYADLRGHSPEPPMHPGQVLDGYLAGLGVPPGRIPSDLDAKAALYRSHLDGRRLLVVLDNAACPQQVRPLLPAEPGCLALVTSRDTLTGLVARDRAHRVTLDVLPLDDAITLLAGFLGPARVAAEAAAARQLALLCACLPVALCAAGERAAARPHATLASIVTDLVTADHRLDLLDVGGDGPAAVRAVLSWSYDRLPADAARLFRLLGLHPGPALDRYGVAALAGTDPAPAGRLIDILLAANLLQPHREDSYRLHEVLRLYAAECAHRHDPPEHRRAALARLFTYYRAAAATALDPRNPPRQRWPEEGAPGSGTRLIRGALFRAA